MSRTLDDECPICMIPFTLLLEIYKTPCKHLFHMPCLDIWMERRDTCPMCRSKISNHSMVKTHYGAAKLDPKACLRTYENLKRTGSARNITFREFYEMKYRASVTKWNGRSLDVPQDLVRYRQACGWYNGKL